VSVRGRNHTYAAEDAEIILTMFSTKDVLIAVSRMPREGSITGRRDGLGRERVSF